MSQSFSTDKHGIAPAALGGPRKVLVTGAAGRIGSYFSTHARNRYELRLMVRGDEDGVEAIRGLGEVLECELSDLPGLKRACSGIDTVLHLAANPDPAATWSDLLENNIVGAYNIMVAAKAAGCRRLVYASSIHAVSGYPPDVQVKTSEPVNPGDLYGVSKCFGEALGRYLAEQENLSVIAIRIGAFQPLESARQVGSIGMLDAFVSHRDLNQLICRCIDAEGVKFALVHGVSNNRFKRLDISDARELFGYDPQDDLTEENPKLRELHLNQEVGAHNLTDGQESGLREELEV